MCLLTKRPGASAPEAGDGRADGSRGQPGIAAWTSYFPASTVNPSSKRHATWGHNVSGLALMVVTLGACCDTEDPEPVKTKLRWENTTVENVITFNPTGQPHAQSITLDVACTLDRIDFYMEVQVGPVPPPINISISDSLFGPALATASLTPSSNGSAGGGWQAPVYPVDGSGAKIALAANTTYFVRLDGSSPGQTANWAYSLDAVSGGEAYFFGSVSSGHDFTMAVYSVEAL